jgi:hypothetical protein
MLLSLMRWESMETKTKEECRFESQIDGYCICQDVGINRFHAGYGDNFLLTTGTFGLNYLKYEFKNSPRTSKLNVRPYVYLILHILNKKGYVN